MASVRNKFDLTGRVAVITGGAGLLGGKHAEAIIEMGGIPVLVDVAADRSQNCAQQLASNYGSAALGLGADITKPEQVEGVLEQILAAFGRVDILINNAANNPKMESQNGGGHWSRFEQLPVSVWDQDVAVGLTGAFLCSQVIGRKMADQRHGVILNIASDLAVIAPDQRIYRQPGLPDNEQPVKPVTYSVVKAGLIGLTRYLSTYWADQGVRVNALSPGGVYNQQEEAFVHRLTNLIPMGRMADHDEYKAAVVFLVSDASAYMTGANVVMDGGRTVW
jgi:NAD(P)-dependent dehydrogenase (short-subunit alcohol dehydrogenase family)